MCLAHSYNLLLSMSVMDTLYREHNDSCVFGVSQWFEGAHKAGCADCAIPPKAILCCIPDIPMHTLLGYIRLAEIL